MRRHGGIRRVIPTPISGEGILIRYSEKDGLTDEQYAEYQALAGKYDPRAKPRKDNTLTIRIETELLQKMKAAAERAGYAKYQSWVHSVLEKAVQDVG